MCAYLRRSTEIPGRFVARGRALTFDEVCSEMNMCQARRGPGVNAGVREAIREMIEIGILCLWGDSENSLGDELSRVRTRLRNNRKRKSNGRGANGEPKVKDKRSECENIVNRKWDEIESDIEEGEIPVHFWMPEMVEDIEKSLDQQKRSMVRWGSSGISSRKSDRYPPSPSPSPPPSPSPSPGAGDNPGGSSPGPKSFSECSREEKEERWNHYRGFNQKIARHLAVEFEEFPKDVPWDWDDPYFYMAPELPAPVDRDDVQAWRSLLSGVARGIRTRHEVEENTKGLSKR
jgi:hypothetical protein